MANKVKNPFKDYIDKLPAPLRNRYFLILVAFFLWMIFIDRHNVLVQWRLQSTLNQLQVDKAYYQEKINEAMQTRYDLQRNREKFAREKYYMKRNNEDVFIIDKDAGQEK